ncbi:MAG: hypothetical protein CM1200mP2_04960 [Planctomycetaceae bacterium]|nr:MAG: hypothetical protein CM1200mP2_04960 [Planctomycetaceae bacterium]
MPSATASVTRLRRVRRSNPAASRGRWRARQQFALAVSIENHGADVVTAEPFLPVGGHPITSKKSVQASFGDQVCVRGDQQTNLRRPLPKQEVAPLVGGPNTFPTGGVTGQPSGHFDRRGPETIGRRPAAFRVRPAVHVPRVWSSLRLRPQPGWPAGRCVVPTRPTSLRPGVCADGGPPAGRGPRPATGAHQLIIREHDNVATPRRRASTSWRIAPGVGRTLPRRRPGRCRQTSLEPGIGAIAAVAIR